MARLYSDHEDFKGKFDFNAVTNPNSYYKTHYANYKMAQFFHQTAKRPNDKIDAAKDMEIADRKMKRWTTHPLFDKRKQEADHKEINAQWSGKRSVHEEVKPGSKIRYGVETSKKNRGIPVIISRNATVKSVDHEGLTTVNGVKLKHDRKVGSRSNIEKGSDWHVIKESEVLKETSDRVQKFMNFRSKKADGNKSTEDMIADYRAKGGKIKRGATQPMDPSLKYKMRERPVKMNVAALKDPNGAAAARNKAASTKSAPVWQYGKSVKEENELIDESWKNTGLKIVKKEVGEPTHIVMSGDQAKKHGIHVPPEDEKYGETHTFVNSKGHTVNVYHREHLGNGKHLVSLRKTSGSGDEDIEKLSKKLTKEEFEINELFGLPEPKVKATEETERSEEEMLEGKTWKAGDYKSQAIKNLRKKRQKDDKDRGDSKRSIEEGKTFKADSEAEYGYKSKKSARDKIKAALKAKKAAREKREVDEGDDDK